MIHDLSVQEFIQLIKKGKKKFTNVSVEDFNFTLRNYDLESVEFKNCFINISLEKCNLKNTKFLFCNLKTISIQDCYIENCYISDCQIESVTITGKNINQIVFGTNYAYGITLNPEKCLLYVQNGIIKNT
ncbi:pentapeptide repeat-containing protein [Leptospira kirschneri]|uniref:Pentapeptide repeat protein n=1 Tax=Leptospira kirschneri str. 200802841 TaxID=1193047 RepID=A0A828XYH5_9LEPT|nr:pentapeptide repeat-containing protein [Leptospira kirschneri]EJO69378.1 pentapeptide repeat protein [Leptospira kirschneri serovar Grippotyphosa str. RM52]EKO52307.1 pentapeptide repeat protein [Leptospira kirschneri str. 200802841]EKP06098.1 pentapeptide repeat protein [Leptospira kirschneri str. 2008720114]EKQ85091.1 pentapeptide repeat protein [Leptospira kirschneri serovar Grippotyphosa str. Moskva]EKR06498.1 pentapeptide repeat protein [Leptospira kirschneri serovar Valbuzzi str. 2007